jgi:hypothetical protein
MRQPARPGPANDRRLNRFGIAISLLTLAIGVFIGQNLWHEHWQQDCLVSAAPSCMPVLALAEPSTKPERSGGWHQLTSVPR